VVEARWRRTIASMGTLERLDFIYQPSADVAADVADVPEQQA